MVNRCVAAGCSNTPSERVSLYKFPSDPRIREKWVKQVKRTRAKWNATKHSVLCSDHFTEDCFEVDSTIAATFGLSKKRRLKPDAVPSIFHRPSLADDMPCSSASLSQPLQLRKRSATTEISSTEKRSKATEKRDRLRVCI